MGHGWDGAAQYPGAADADCGGGRRAAGRVEGRGRGAGMTIRGRFVKVRITIIIRDPN